jgi:hypothetical protein
MGVVVLPVFLVLFFIIGLISIIILSVGLQDVIPSSLPKQRRFEKYQIILIWVSTFLSALYNYVFWITLSLIGLIGSYKYKSHFTRLYAISLIVISLFNLSNIILSVFTEIGLIMATPGNLISSIITIIGSMIGLVVVLSICLLCGFCAYKDSNSIQYSTVSAEDLTSVEVDYSASEVDPLTGYQASEVEPLTG